jgi:ribonuclease T2
LRRHAAIALAIVVAAAHPAAARTLGQRLSQNFSQNGQIPCILDKCLSGGAGGSAPQRSAPIPPSAAGDGSSGPGNFDFYVLSLSWSSGFCETGGGGRPSNQCNIGSGLGFVVHGLWPQYEHGFPSNCATDRPVSQIALNEAQGLFPDDGLARYEWRKHGTCSGKSPQAYFADVRRALQAVTIPPDLRHPLQDLVGSPRDLITDFLTSNAGLRPDMMAVGCKGTTLQEVRICFTRDLRSFRSCTEVSRDTCHASQIQVPHVR